MVYYHCYCQCCWKLTFVELPYSYFVASNMDWNADCSPASSCLLDFVLDFEDTYFAYLIGDFPLSKVFLERNLKKTACQAKYKHLAMNAIISNSALGIKSRLLSLIRNIWWIRMQIGIHLFGLFFFLFFFITNFFQFIK